MPRAILQAGHLPHRINILAPSFDQSPSGGIDIGEQVVIWHHLPAAIETLTGREVQAAQGIVAQVSHKVTIRWISNIRARYNVEWPADGGAEYDRFFQIVAVQNPDNIRHLMILLCLERNDSLRSTP